MGSPAKTRPGVSSQAFDPLNFRMSELKDQILFLREQGKLPRKAQSALEKHGRVLSPRGALPPTSALLDWN